MIYRIVDLGRDYPGRISDFSEARNSFLTGLPEKEYVLYKDSDVEAPQMLLDHIALLKPEMPWYDIRQINLIDNEYQPLQNPFYTGVLVSNKCRWKGRVHEKVYPRYPHGVIDIPLIHNHKGPTLYNGGSPPRVLLAARKLYEIMLHGYT